MATSVTKLEVKDYTPKSFVLLGDTLSHKDQIEKLGGKWNNSLTDKETGVKFGGWIFPMHKKNNVLRDLNISDKAASLNHRNFDENWRRKETETPISHHHTKVFQPEAITSDIDQRLARIETKLDAIMIHFNINKTPKTSFEQKHVDDEYEDSFEIEDVPMKSLFRKSTTK